MNLRKGKPPTERFSRTRDINSFQRSFREISGDVILIVCDGEKTEPYYFDALRNIWKISCTQVEVVRGDKKDPTNIIKRAIKLREERKKDAKNEMSVEYDQIWCVFDNDNRTKTIARAIQEAEKEKFKCALSTPCFEIWYLLHHVYTTSAFQNYQAIVHELKKHYPNYKKTECDIQYWLDRLDEALKNAARLRKENKQDHRKNPSTDVDLLVAELKNLRRSC